MKKELEQALVEKYPLLYVDYNAPSRNDYTRMNDGFCCGDGWYKLIDNTSQKLVDIINTYPQEERVQYKIFQVKQKLGGLRISFGFTGNRDIGLVNKLIKIASDAEVASAKICEHCGKDGKRVSIKNWITVMCDTCLLLS